MKTTIYTILTPELEKQWTALWHKLDSATIFNSPGWLKAYLQSFPPVGLQIITISQNQELLAVLPLIPSRLLGVRVLTPPAGDFAQRSGLLVDLNDLPTLRQLYEEIQLLGQVYLGHLSTSEMLQLDLAGFKPSVINRSVSPRLSLAAGSSGKFVLSKRSQILKKAREAEPDLELQSHFTHPDQVMAQVFDLDNQSTKHQYQYNVFADKHTQEFYLSLAKLAPKLLAVNFLLYKQTPVAYEIGFIVHKSTYLDSERAYLSGQEWYTPGKVLLVKLAEALADLKFKVLDLGPGEDNLKRALTSDGLEFTNCLVGSNPHTSTYLARAWAVRETIYHWLFTHPQLYSIYRRLKP